MLRAPIVSIVVLTLALALSGCREPAPEFVLPTQRPPLETYKPPPARVISMSDPDAPARFLRDITNVASPTWRWTGQRPAVRIRVRNVQNVRYLIDFSIAQITFKETGPVTVVFTVNDHQLGREHYTDFGPKHFEKAVPPEWLEANKDAIAGAEIDKIWVSKEDGARFGFILSRIGLAQ